MNETKAWSIEERFWLEGASVYHELLDPACLMAFPGMGVMHAAEVQASIQNAPRWASVRMDDRHFATAGDVTVLGYTATGSREGAKPYRCFCTSTYRAVGSAWKLVQHQQTIAS